MSHSYESNLAQDLAALSLHAARTPIRSLVERTPRAPARARNSEPTPASIGANPEVYARTRRSLTNEFDDCGPVHSTMTAAMLLARFSQACVGQK